MLLLPIILPIFGGILVFRLKTEYLRNRAVLAIVVATAVAVGGLCILPEQSMELMTIQGLLTIALRNDFLARLFMVLIAVIWVPVAVFSQSYLRHNWNPRRFQGFFVITMGILMGVGLARNFVTLYMFFEMTSLITMPLVLHNSTAAARQAGFKYLGYSVFGAGMALAGYFFLSYYTISPDFVAGGTMNFALLEGHRQLLLIVYFIMMVGFGAKAGMMPMQAWLPTAHPVAPAPGSAVLSGVITKAGVLAMIRVTYYMYGPTFLQGSWAQKALIGLALATVFVGSMLAVREKQLKKRLAYSTVSQVSYALFGLLLLTPSGFRGAMLQIVFHALAKDTLFLAAGAVIMATSYTRVDQLRGIGKRMPLTMYCFTIASLSLIGIPPMSGFVSKWYLAMAALTDPIPWVGIAGVLILILSAVLTAGYLLPIVTNGFFPGKDCIVEHTDVGMKMNGPLIFFCVLAAWYGVFPQGLIHHIDALILQIF